MILRGNYMIAQFGFSNFLSYFESTVIQFLTNTKETSFKDDVVGNRFYRCLKYVSLFGKNASGKSSLIEAVLLFKDAVMNNKTLLTHSKRYCRTRKDNAQKPSTFEIVLVIDDTFYQYGFSIILSSGKIVDEYLNKITPSTNNLVKIFARQEKTLSIKSGVRSMNDVEYRINDAIIRNELFLTNMGTFLKASPNEDYSIILDIYNFITEKIVIINKNISSQYLYLTDTIDPHFKEILNQFDFNIKDIIKRKLNWESFSSALNESQLKDINHKLFSESVPVLIMVFGSKVIMLKKDAANNIKIEEIIFRHFNSDSDFDYYEESNGTLRIMDFIPIILMNEGISFFIDEIEQSLSPDIVVSFFNKLRDENSNDQILFTTHTDSLFSDKLFRKDSYYIVDKNDKGESYLKRLSQFENVYSETNINSKFVKGSYGGRPNIY